ncbi:condensation domain-containing protein, partial [Actinoalloteichus caeruleus]|uniref:condensation domain-containing protein n=1 Tax=Actinoalloteichus cyanogriseus TaxID=2893586 RepID=UPI0012DF216B
MPSTTRERSCDSGVVDLSTVPERQRPGLLEHRLREEVETPFDLRNGPVFRWCLFHVEDNDSVLTMTMHHVATDGWSLGVLATEFAECYTAHVEHRVPALPDLPITYRDYAAWQRHH